MNFKKGLAKNDQSLLKIDKISVPQITTVTQHPQLLACYETELIHANHTKLTILGTAL